MITPSASPSTFVVTADVDVDVDGEISVLTDVNSIINEVVGLLFVDPSITPMSIDPTVIIMLVQPLEIPAAVEKLGYSVTEHWYGAPNVSIKLHIEAIVEELT